MSAGIALPFLRFRLWLLAQLNRLSTVAHHVLVTFHIRGVLNDPVSPAAVDDLAVGHWNRVWIPLPMLSF